MQSVIYVQPTYKMTPARCAELLEQRVPQSLMAQKESLGIIRWPPRLPLTNHQWTFLENEPFHILSQISYRYLSVQCSSVEHEECLRCLIQ